jgi:hypothetical protein
MRNRFEKTPRPSARPTPRRTNMQFRDLSKAFRVEISSCARCGGDHTLVALPFVNPTEDEWTHWAWCPKTSDPILIKQTDES